MLPVSRGTLAVLFLVSHTDSLIHGSLANSLFHPIHACAHSCFDGCRAGFGVGSGFCARAPVSFLSDVPDVADDEDDACMDGSNSLIQGSGCHATACTCPDALHNSRQVRGHCLRGGTKCTSTGSGAKVWLSDEIRVPYLIRSQKVCMSRRGLVRKSVSPRRVSRTGSFSRVCFSVLLRLLF